MTNWCWVSSDSSDLIMVRLGCLSCAQEIMLPTHADAEAWKVGHRQPEVRAVIVATHDDGQWHQMEPLTGSDWWVSTYSGPPHEFMDPHGN